MDLDRIDDIARSLATNPTRRGVLGLAIGSVLGTFPLTAAEAKKGKKKKRKKGKEVCTVLQLCGNDCCQGGFICATAFNGIDQACCLASLACPGSQTGCCSSGLTCVERVAPPAGTPTHACVT